MRKILFGFSTLLLLGACASSQNGFNSEASPLIPDPQPKLFVPSFSKHSLPNGAAVYVGPDVSLPSVSIAFAFRGGTLEEPTFDAGKTALMWHAMLQRTARLDRKQLTGAFDDTAVPKIYITPDAVVVQATVLVDRVEPLLAVMAEFIQRPSFVDENIQRARALQMERLAASASSPASIAQLSLNRVVFGEGHRLAIPTDGTLQTLSTLTPDALLAWHRHLVRPERLSIVVSGRIESSEAVAALTKAFGSWKAEVEQTVQVAKQVAPFEPEKAPKRNVVYGVSRPGLSQTVICAGRLALPGPHKDRPALDLLSVMPAGKISTYLRTLHGVTYGVSPFYDSFATVGVFGIQTAVQASATKQAMTSIFDSYEAVSAAGSFSSNYLAIASTQLLWAENSMDFTIEGRALWLALNLQLGLPPDNIRVLHDHISGMRSAEFELLAQAYLKPGNLQVVMVGDPAVIKDAVQSMSFTQLKWLE
jgi:zinc protease